MSAGRSSFAAVLAVGYALFASTGCANRLAFGTATKLGIDISQRPDQTIDMSFGYDRQEAVVIPVATKDKDGKEIEVDATTGRDTYSVLGTFQVKYGNPFTGGTLYIHQFFATGRAAVWASKTGALRSLFGTVAGEIYGQGKKEATKDATKEPAPKGGEGNR